MNPLYLAIARRAGHRCEYCHAPEAIFNFPFEVEHIIPAARGGANDLSNLALACRACNVSKGDRLRAVDDLSGEDIGLFDPRRDRWEEHFRVDIESGEIMGTTPTGRATIAALRMNRPAQLAARRQWMRLDLFP